MTNYADIAKNVLPSGPLGDKVKTGLWIIIAIAIIFGIYVAIKGSASFINGLSNMFSFGGLLNESPESKQATADANAADIRAQASDSPFNPTLYKSAPAGTKLKTQAVLSQLANQVYDSVGAFYDDPESGFAAIKQCTNWAMVSQLSDKFNQMFGKDMYSWLRIKYDTTTQKQTLAKIVNYAFSLPRFN